MILNIKLAVIHHGNDFMMKEMKFGHVELGYMMTYFI